MTRSARTGTRFVALDRSRCDACWDCIGVCPDDVLYRVDVWFHRHVAIRDGERCRGCRRCVQACRSGALIPRSPTEEVGS